MSAATPDFTGLRAIVERTPRRIMQQHLARYAFASEYAKGKDTVLDIACGSGYGVDIMAKAGAKQVFGVDIDPEAVNFANAQYGREGVSFRQGDGASIPFEDNHFDVVTSFETIEHLLDTKAFVRELSRVVKPEGALIISVPNAPFWSPFSKDPDLSNAEIRNGFGHKYNFTSAQFFQILGEHFREVERFGQDFRVGSVGGQVLRQSERGVILMKYKLAKVFQEGGPLRGFLREVLPDPNHVFTDPEWTVRPWSGGYQPIFAVAVCRVPKK